MDELRAARLLGCPERRTHQLTEFEVRGGTGNTFVVRGYASVFGNAYPVYGGPERGGWDETIRQGAFATTLAAKPDVSFLINHEGMPLARTRSGTLQLREDMTGLESEATVDRRDPFGQALEVKMERGDLDQMSFGFRVTRQEWNDDYTQRGIVEVNLDHGDVSIVNTPANPATSMSIVSARSAIGVLREMELAEARASLGDLRPEELREAQERLAQLAAHMTPPEEREEQPEEQPEERERITLSQKIEKLTPEKKDQALRALLTIVVGDDDDDDDEPAGEPEGAESDDDDQDDDQVSALIALVTQLLQSQGVIPRAATEPEVEEREETPAEETPEAPTVEERSVKTLSFEEARALALGESA